MVMDRKYRLNSTELLLNTGGSMALRSSAGLYSIFIFRGHEEEHVNGVTGPVYSLAFGFFFPAVNLGKREQATEQEDALARKRRKKHLIST